MVGMGLKDSSDLAGEACRTHHPGRGKRISKELETQGPITFRKTGSVIRDWHQEWIERRHPWGSMLQWGQARSGLKSALDLAKCVKNNWWVVFIYFHCEISGLPRTEARM